MYYIKHGATSQKSRTFIPLPRRDIIASCQLGVKKIYKTMLIYSLNEILLQVANLYVSVLEKGTHTHVYIMSLYAERAYTCTPVCMYMYTKEKNTKEGHTRMYMYSYFEKCMYYIVYMYVYYM